MQTKNIFMQIVKKQINADIVYQDNLVTAFKDINPQAPVHYLVIPNVEIKTVNDALPEHELTLGRMFTVAAKIAKENNIDEDGYRLIVNCNKHGGQEVYHLHMHILGGKQLGKMIPKD